MNVFCDSDGVLVDFEGGFLRNFGFTHDSVQEGVMWKYIVSHDRHWADLPPMADALVLWDFLKPYNPTILTGCPSSGFDAAVQGKTEYYNNFAPGTKVIACLTRNKPQHMIAPGDILIDDMAKNIKRWEEAGGVGILHTSAVDTIAKFNAILEKSNNEELV